MVAKCGYGLIVQSMQPHFYLLSLPIKGSVSSIESRARMTKRIEAKLANWNGNMLPIVGRITVIKAFNSSLPIYYMSLFPTPSVVIEKIKKLQRQFLWNGASDKPSFALVSWDLMEIPAHQTRNKFEAG